MFSFVFLYFFNRHLTKQQKIFKQNRFRNYMNHRWICLRMLLSVEPLNREHHRDWQRFFLEKSK